MNIYTHTYKLVPRTKLNSLTDGSEREGALLKVEFEDNMIGYADVFPWVELGDGPLLDQLWSLKTGDYSESVKQSLQLARLDAEARAGQHSLFRETVSVKNHFLISDLLSFDHVELVGVNEKGFDRIKCKMGAELLRETMWLEELVDVFPTEFKLRLDFNCSLDFDEFEAWLPSLTPSLRDSIEYLEDPFPYNGDFWQALSEVHGVTLALDHAADPIATKAIGADIVVVKPAKQNAMRILSELAPLDKKFVITHYMDHPVGRMGAVHMAMVLKAKYGDDILQCGLNDFGLYEQTEFSKGLVATEAESLFSRKGSGIGFDQLLEDLEWRKWT